MYYKGKGEETEDERQRRRRRPSGAPHRNPPYPEPPHLGKPKSHTRHAYSSPPFPYDIIALFRYASIITSTYRVTQDKTIRTRQTTLLHPTQL